MPRSYRLFRLIVPVVLIGLPSMVMAQDPGPAPEPPLDPMPGSQAPRTEKLPPLDPIAPADEPSTSPVPPPRRSTVGTPRPQPVPAPAADEMVPVQPQPAPRTVVPGGAVIEEDEPVMIQQAPAPAPAPAVVVAPRSNLVWVAGHFEKKPDVVETLPARWEKPLIGAPRYVPSRYVTRPGKIVWVEGHWVQTPGTAVVARPVVAAPAPASRPVVVSKPVYADPNVRVVQSPPVIRTATPAVVTAPAPAPAVIAPAPSVVVPGQWRQGLLGNWRYVPGHVEY